jgi:hypothetical protein
MNNAETFEKGLKNIRRGARRFGKFRKRWAVLNGLACFIIASPGALLIWFGLDWGLTELGVPMPYWLLLPLFAVVCGISLWACAKWLLRPAMRRIRAEHEALVIENLHGELDNALIGSMQLGDELASGAGSSLGYAEDLVRELVRRSAARLAEIRPKKLVDLSRTLWHLAGSLPVVALVVLSVLFASGAIQARALRLSDAYAAFVELLFPVTFHVTPGNAAVVRGRPVGLEVMVEGARGRKVELILTDVETRQEARPEVPELKDRRTRYELPGAENTFVYVFKYRTRRSPEFKIMVDDLPEIQAIQYEMSPPKYTGHPTRMIKGRIGKLQELRGTEVLISFAATTDLDPENCYVEWPYRDGDAKTGPMDVSGRFGSFSFIVEDNERLAIHLTGVLGEGFEMAEPANLEIAVRNDKRPTIKLYGKMDETMHYGSAGGLRVPYLAKDDFGVTEVAAEVNVSTKFEILDRGKREKKITKIIDPPRTRVKDKFSGLFEGMEPRPQSGDEIKIRLRAVDNNIDAPKGPGIGWSEEITILLVSKIDITVFGKDIIGDFSPDELASRIRELGRMKQLDRETGLGARAIKKVTWQPVLPVEKKPVNANPGVNTMLDLDEDPVSKYFDLLTQSDDFSGPQADAGKKKPDDREMN